jgi:excisionase family DNA binding protein
MEKYLTISQAAEILALSPKALRRKIARREVPFVHVGRLVRIPASQLQRYISGFTGCDADEARSRLKQRAA